MWQFFQSLFDSGGWLGGVFVSLGRLNYNGFVTCLITDLPLSCVNLFSGAEFNFSLNIFTTISSLSSNDIFNSVLKLFMLIPIQAVTLMNTVVGVLMSYIGVALPIQTPAFIGVAVYFLFFYGFLKLAVTLVSKVVSLMTGTLFGG